MGTFNNNLLSILPQSFTTNGSGENTNVLVTSSVMLCTPGATNDSISGFIPNDDLDGLLLWLINIHATYNLLLSVTTNSTSGYRVTMASGLTTLTMGPKKNVLLLYRQGSGWVPQYPGTFS